MNKESIKDALLEGAKASPPVAATATSVVQGWTLSTLLTALTIVYITLQIAWLLWRWRRAAVTGVEVKAE